MGKGPGGIVDDPAAGMLRAGVERVASIRTAPGLGGPGPVHRFVTLFIRLRPRTRLLRYANAPITRPDLAPDSPCRATGCPGATDGTAERLSNGCEQIQQAMSAWTASRKRLGSTASALTKSAWSRPANGLPLGWCPGDFDQLFARLDRFVVLIAPR